MPLPMKAMKVMKQAMKKKPPPMKKNPPLNKGAANKTKPLNKGAAKTNPPLNKGTLNKLGQLSLRDKVKQIAESQEDEVEAAMVLKEEMTPAEKVRAWNRYDTHLKKDGNEEEKEEFKNSSKNEKGLKAALFLMRTEAPKFCSVSKQASLEQQLTKNEKSLSEKEAIEKWGEDDLYKHCASGRVIYKETSTKDVYEYQDTQDYSRTSTAKKAKTWMMAQEFQQHPDEEEPWLDQLDKDLMILLQDTPGKGKGKGKGKLNDTPGKGKGRGKHGKGEPKAIEDLPPEEQMHEALNKLRKLRDMLGNCATNFEEALAKVKKLGYLTKAGLKGKEDILKALEKALQSVKQHLAKGEKSKLKALKDVLLEGAEVLKEAKEESKELVQIIMKTQSKAGSKK